MAAVTDNNHEMIVEILRLRAAALAALEGAARAALFDAADAVESLLRLALRKSTDSRL